MRESSRNPRYWLVYKSKNRSDEKRVVRRGTEEVKEGHIKGEGGRSCPWLYAGCLASFEDTPLHQGSARKDKVADAQ